jgi:hypothetical protein
LNPRGSKSADVLAGGGRQECQSLFHGFAGEGDDELQSIKNGLLKIAYSQRDPRLSRRKQWFQHLNARLLLQFETLGLGLQPAGRPGDEWHSQNLIRVFDSGKAAPFAELTLSAMKAADMIEPTVTVKPVPVRSSSTDSLLVEHRSAR